MLSHNSRQTTIGRLEDLRAKHGLQELTVILKATGAAVTIVQADGERRFVMIDGDAWHAVNLNRAIKTACGLAATGKQE